MTSGTLQTVRRPDRFLGRLESLAEKERGQLPLWMPVALGLGIAAWFLLPGRGAWIAFLLLTLSIALAGMVLPWGTRVARALAMAGMLAMLGCALVWWRAERVAAPVLARPVVAVFVGVVERVEPLPAREAVRLTLRPDATAQLPPRIRVNLAEKDMRAGVVPGARIALRARLMPPPTAAVPGAYDFARTAWFQGLGATGRGFAAVRVVAAGRVGNAGLRGRLTDHILSRVGGSTGGIAAAFVTGDRGAITEEDAEAMRRSGLAHLLSISGLHVTAVVVATMTVVLKLLALFPPLALRVRLPIVAAGAGAGAALFYTWLSGADVPPVSIA